MKDRGFCRDCGAPILWVQMAKSGNWNAFNVSPDSSGRFYIDDAGFGRFLRAGETSKDRYTSHLGTCPHSQPRQTPPSSDSPYRVLYLAETAPLAVVKAAYRALAQIHHPDVGGDTAQMQRVNAAYERILRERG